MAMDQHMTVFAVRTLRILAAATEGAASATRWEAQGGKGDAAVFTTPILEGQLLVVWEHAVLYSARVHAYSDVIRVWSFEQSTPDGADSTTAAACSAGVGLQKVVKYINDSRSSGRASTLVKDLRAVGRRQAAAAHGLPPQPRTYTVVTDGMGVGRNSNEGAKYIPNAVLDSDGHTILKYFLFTDDVARTASCGTVRPPQPRIFITLDSWYQGVCRVVWFRVQNVLLSQVPTYVSVVLAESQGFEGILLSLIRG